MGFARRISVGSRLAWACLASLPSAVIAGGASAGEAAPEAISGFKFERGAYRPDESFVEGTARATGLQQPFPAMKSLDKDPITAAKVELGKLLFFDPILSGDNSTSCASCHHPDLGFADGRKTGAGVGGKGFGPAREGGRSLMRNTPSVWNAAYYKEQFWDGRAADLEEQSLGPIKNPDEMNQNMDDLLKELSAIPEYVSLFQKTFRDDSAAPITGERIAQAIASFERTVLSFNSKFDRYAAGDMKALNPQERSGLKLFRSLKTRCFECHSFPLFADNTFRVLGLPEEDGSYDEGRAAVPGQGPKGAFKVPTLRNIDLTAPYMHNGAHKTLEEVVDFYAKGGGHQFEKKIDAIDDKINKFDITETEQADLVAFMKALTDTSLQPEPPAKVPSGLPVVEAKTKAQAPLPPAQIAAADPGERSGSGAESEGGDPRRSEAAKILGAAREHSGSAASAGSGGRGGSAAGAGMEAKLAGLSRPRALASGATFKVTPGQSIQAAIDRALPGDAIEVYPGVYNEALTVERAGVSLIGISVNGEGPVLDGRGTLADALQGNGDDFTLQGFTIRNYTGNGIVNSKSRNVVYRDLIVKNSGLYGLYPVECEGVLVEGCTVSGATDAGIYVGQSRDVVVRDSLAYENVAGIEIENCVNALVVNNTATNNTGGILVFLLPSGASKVANHCKVIGNRSIGNNHVNFGKVGTIVSNIPPGTGMLIMAADHTEVTGNEIYDNRSQGVIVMSFLTSQWAPKDKYELDIEPDSDNNLVHDNTYRNNGYDPAKLYALMKIPGVDILWDGQGKGNGWREAAEIRRYPAELPEASGLEPLAGFGGAGF